MPRNITDLESIIEPISVLFSRASATDNLDVPAPHNMYFSEDNTITLVWKLTDLSPMDSIGAYEKIKSLALSDFSQVDHKEAGISIFTAKISWHGEYPDVYFRVLLPIEVTKCPSLIGNQSVSS